MNAVVDWFGGGQVSWLPFVLDVAFKSAVILIGALVATRALRGASASLRHHVWTLAFAAVLALPLLAGSLPSWRVALPGWTEPVTPAPWTVPVEAPVAARSAPMPPVDAVEATDPAGDGAREVTVGVFVPSADPTTGFERANGSSGPAPLLLIVGIWAVGALLLLARLSIGVVSAWWTTRCATPVTDTGWTRRVDEIAYELGIRSRVRVLQSPWVGSPMAWGILRPTLLLPPEAPAWSADRRRAVVLHELAHIKRRDCLVHLVAQAARAVHWLNPLAWVGARRLRAERERACDDLVLTSGTRSADYARLLLDVARARGDRRLVWATVSMARPSELEGRLLAILDPARDRSGVGRPGALAAVALAGLLVVPLAAFQAAPTATGVPETMSAPVPGPAPDPAVATAPGPAATPEPTASASSTQAVTASPSPTASLRARSRSVARARVTVPSGAIVADTVDSRVIDAMLRALSNDHAPVRARAAHALGMTESPRAVAGLSAALSDASAEVRSEAAWGLGMIEDAEAVRPLTGVLSDSSPAVRSRAAWALGMIESSEAVDALVLLLEDDAASVRSQAAWALGMIESESAVDGLIRVVSSDESADVRSNAAWALGMIEDPRATDALIDAIEDADDDVATQAMWALGRVLDS